MRASLKVLYRFYTLVRPYAHNVQIAKINVHMNVIIHLHTLRKLNNTLYI
ncbi:hypothetical protein VCR31J2_1360064 [Vibrio coralliirubri]|uniref:Uncharacterized protein n=1 Tax=Vibrio coralliirubri TaxID=1516159 RepID=A0AA87C2I9_9VIBR|nr:hypothetical protein VCR31J2_1360064 [Vibrio coralliirubri]